SRQPHGADRGLPPLQFSLSSHRVLLKDRARLCSARHDSGANDAHAATGSALTRTSLIAHTIVRNLIEFFALGALPRDLMEQIGDHLAACAECRAYAEPSRQVAQLLLLAAPPTEPPWHL